MTELFLKNISLDACV